MKLSYLTSVGITVGLLAGAWVFAAGEIGIASWVGFLGWATYFALGKGAAGVPTGIACNLSGVVWGLIGTWIISFLPGSYTYLIVIVACAALMCWQARFSILSFIPGTFIGNAAFWGIGLTITSNPGAWDWKNIAFLAIGLVCGVLLGLASDYAAKAISAKQQATA
jgi:hypothetical protein